MVINVIIKRLHINHGCCNCRHVKCAITCVSLLGNYGFNSVWDFDFLNRMPRFSQILMSLCSPSRADVASDNTIYPLILLGMVHCKNIGSDSESDSVT